MKSVIWSAVPNIGFIEMNIRSHSLCIGGVTDFLMERADPDTTLLVVWWWSNKILHYIHTTEKGFTNNLEMWMFQHSDYAII